MNLWDQILARIETKVNRHSFYTWFKPTSFLAEDRASVTVRVPPGTPSGRVLRVRGRGVPRRDGSTGDLLVTVEVTIPKDLPESARKALEEYARAAPPAAREHIERQVRHG